MPSCPVASAQCRKEGLRFKLSAKSFSLNKDICSSRGGGGQEAAQAAINNASMPQMEFASALRSSESQQMLFLCSLFFLWCGGWLWEKGKSLRGAVLMSFLHLPPPPCSSSLPSPAASIAVSDRLLCQILPEGWSCSWLWEADWLRVCNLNTDFRAQSKQDKLQLSTAWDCCLPAKRSRRIWLLGNDRRDKTPRISLLPNGKASLKAGWKLPGIANRGGSKIHSC